VTRAKKRSTHAEEGDRGSNITTLSQWIKNVESGHRYMKDVDVSWRREKENKVEEEE
jgi:hypothetical protein